jgi:hypothetical protein
MEPDVGLDGTKTRYIRVLQRYIHPNVINCLRPEPNAEEGGRQISKAEETSRKGTFSRTVASLPSFSCAFTAAEN